MPTVELIIPPNPYLGDPMRNAPLGLLYIAAMLELNNIAVKVTDLRDKTDCKKEIGFADIYGFTASTPDYPAAIALANIAKRKNPNAWVALGGVHATCMWNNIDPIFDKVVMGEGECSILDLVSDHILTAGKNHARYYYRSAPIHNLDTIPFPARHLLPFRSAFSEHALFHNAGPTATIITSRGCPFACAFCCSEKLSGRLVRFRSSENVLAELNEIIHRYGVTNFRFHDDTMTLNRNRLMKICEGMKPLKIRWRAETRVDQVSPEMLRGMKEVGCEEIAFGVESLSQDVLDVSNKGIHVSNVSDAIIAAKLAGMQVRLYFMIGLPKEKPGFADRLISFCEKLHPDAVDLSTFVPFPGSAIYENPEKFGLTLLNQNFGEYVMTKGLGNSETESDFAFQHDVMTNDELKEERKKALEYLKSMKMVKNY